LLGGLPNWSDDRPPGLFARESAGRAANYPTWGTAMDVAGWLRGLCLEQYEPNLRDNKVDVAVLPQLTTDELFLHSPPQGPPPAPGPQRDAGLHSWPELSTFTARDAPHVSSLWKSAGYGGV
jgi:hypothetical protein